MFHFALGNSCESRTGSENIALVPASLKNFKNEKNSKKMQVVYI